MFDHDKTVTMTGTVKEFEWTNPHAWLHIAAADDQGKMHNWAFEMGAPAQEAKAGWAPTTVKPGDQVSVNFHPLKDGSHGGQLLNVVLAGRQACRPQPTTTAPCSRNKIRYSPALPVKLVLTFPATHA